MREMGSHVVCPALHTPAGGSQQCSCLSPAHERHNEGIRQALVAPLDERAQLGHFGMGPPTSPAIASSWGLGNILIASSGHNRDSHCGFSLLKKAVPVALQCLQFTDAHCPFPNHFDRSVYSFHTTDNLFFLTSPCLSKLCDVLSIFPWADASPGTTALPPQSLT